MAEHEPFTSVEELFKTLIGTGGIMLALLWGLMTRMLSPESASTIRLASVILVVSIAASILGLQFIVTELEKRTTSVSKVPTVAWSFMAAWITFLAGSVCVVYAIFGVDAISGDTQ